MDRERWKRIEIILDRALDLPEEQREGYLDEACAGDAALRAEIAELLAEDRAPGPLDANEGQVAAALEDHGAEDVPGAGLPERIGSYRIEAKLGEGGMGIVYRALQQDPRRQVALKVLRAGMDSRVVLARFEAERQALAVMDHPHIAKVFEAGVTREGLPYFVMEYVDGEPITAYCDRKALSTTARLELFMAVSDAVQHAHRKGIIHRDLKPTNVLVTERDGSPSPKVIDFGIAKAIDREAAMRTAFTEHGQFVGTPEYMSPEQAALSPDIVDTRTDVYSLGVLLYELLTGLLPFEAQQLRRAGFDEMRRIIRETDPPRPSTRLRTLDEQRTSGIGRARGIDAAALARLLEGELDWIVLRALEKEPGRRYGSPEAFAADVRRFLRHEAVEARPTSRLYRLRKFVRRHRLGVGVIVAALVGVMGFAGAMAWQAARIAREAEAKARVTEFLTSLFKVSDPSEARGNTVTAREILDRGAVRIRDTLADEPQVRAELLATMGAVYNSLGLFAQAAPLLEDAVETQRRVLGPEHPATLRSLMSLVTAHLGAGSYPEAERVARETLAICNRELGPERTETLGTMNNLANVLYARGSYDEAEALWGESLVVQRRVLGPDHREVFVTMGNLASVRFVRADYARAEEIWREALELQRRALGGDHPDTLRTMGNLARAFAVGGKPAEAEALYRETIEIKKRVLGNDHAAVLLDQSALGSLLWTQRRLAEAEALLVETIETEQRVLGPEHSQTLAAMGNLSNVYASAGRYEKAAALDRETLALTTRVLGLEHPQTLNAMSNLGDSYYSLGRYAEAEALHGQVLSLRERILGPDHPETLRSLYNLACVAALQGHREEALHHLSDAVSRGFSNATSLLEDPDLGSLRELPGFSEIVTGATANEAPSADQN